MINNKDGRLLNGLQNMFKCDFMDHVMPEITWLGDGGFVWLGASGSLMCTKKYRKQGMLLLTGLSAGFIYGNIILKNAIARPRPCWIDKDVPMLIPIPKDYSFPSCHTLSSVIAATILTKTNKKFGCFAIPLAGLISFSRLYLYVHFPSDILFSV